MLTLLTRVVSMFRKHPAAAWLVTLLIVAPAVVPLRG